MGEFEGSIHLVCRNVIESFSFVSFGQGIPIYLGCLEERKGAHHVDTRKGEGVLDAAVHMAFGCQVDDAFDVVGFHYLNHFLIVADIGLYKGVVRGFLHVLEVGKVAGIGELVEVYDVIFGIFVYEEPYHVASYEAGSSCD